MVFGPTQDNTTHPITTSPFFKHQKPTTLHVMQTREKWVTHLLSLSAWGTITSNLIMLHVEARKKKSNFSTKLREKKKVPCKRGLVDFKE